MLIPYGKVVPEKLLEALNKGDTIVATTREFAWPDMGGVEFNCEGQRVRSDTPAFQYAVHQNKVISTTH